jgi:hypothetical protein
VSRQAAAARSDYNAEAPRAFALLKRSCPVTSFLSSPAYWAKSSSRDHHPLRGHPPLAEAYPSVVLGRKGEALPRAARRCTALARPARAVEEAAGAPARLFMQGKIRAIGVSKHRCPFRKKRFPCAAKDRLSIRQKFALLISKGDSVKPRSAWSQRPSRSIGRFLASPPRRGIRPSAKNTVTVWPPQLSHGVLSHPHFGIFSNFGSAGSVGIHFGRRLLISLSLNQL